MEVLTWEALGTIAGAAAAATIVAQVMLMLWPTVQAKVVRIAMLVVAVALAEGVALSSALTVQAGVVALFVGLSAALAAQKAYETLKHGFSAEVGSPEAPSA